MITTPNIQVWSYSHDPSSSAKDAVRFIVGDTNSDDKLLDDNEILYTLSEEGNVRQAAISCLQNLIVVFSRQVDSQNKEKSKSASQRVESFRTALTSLLEKQAMSGLSVFAGGLTRSGKLTQTSDTDRVRPVFAKNMMDNPRAIQPNQELSPSQEGD